MALNEKEDSSKKSLSNSVLRGIGEKAIQTIKDN